MSDSKTVATRVAEIEERIVAACARAGRPRDSVRLIGASKRQPAAVLESAIAAGVRTFGENRVQEAVAKSPVLPVDIDWHLIGPLQSNKAKRAVRLFSTFHALDRPKIIARVEREAAAAGRRLVGLVQVNVGNEATKHGFVPDDLADALEPYATLEHLHIVGLMAIPPYEADLDAARAWFRRLRALRDTIGDRPEWQSRGPWPGWLSMGMSHDFEIAIEEGATHVRVGSALFGPRPD